MTAYCLDPPFVFLHVPRTGGIAFYRALREQMPRAVVLDAHGGETHMSFREAQNRWPMLPKICVMRSPWEIYASCYRLHQHYATLDLMPPQLAGDERLFRMVGRLTFRDWVNTMIATGHLNPPGGFSVRYCGSRVLVLQYDRRPYQRLAEMLGVRLVLPRVNGGWKHPRWTRELIDQVGRYCWMDIERFGYEPPAD